MDSHQGPQSAALSRAGLHTEAVEAPWGQITDLEAHKGRILHQRAIHPKTIAANHTCEEEINTRLAYGW